MFNSLKNKSIKFLFGFLLTVILIGLSSSMDKSNQMNSKEGNWEGCIVGMYPENGNEKIPSGNLHEIDDFETITGQKVGSVVWFPTWDDEFPTLACNKLAEREIIPHLTWELFWPSKDPNNSSQTGPDGYQGFNDVLAGKYDDEINAGMDDSAYGAELYEGTLVKA